MQNEIIKETELLDGRGCVAEPGWARRSLYRYQRQKIKAPGFRVKEWDYYCVMSLEYGLALTAADNGYMGFFAVTLFDFINRTEKSGTVMTALPLGRLNMPESSGSGDVIIDEAAIRMSFVHEGGKRVLRVDYPGFDKGRGLTAELELFTPAGDEAYDRMVIATPFHKRGRFYFNEKHNCLPARGTVRCGDFGCSFGGDDSASKAWAVLDWGRGVWTYKNTWYWGSASGVAAGKPFGFNIGYGFGDTSAATENMLFYEGRAHKLEGVKFNIPGEAEGAERYMDPWTFTSSDGRFEMTFTPILDRASDANVLIIRSSQHQVFGHFSGKAVLDDSQVVDVDNLPGFAEKVYNRW
ncbi:MAG: DUF2804 domain-containing protein [Spirochaetales bacterium]|uniref:DUF2804 domain-containing protein n=1 Tax=Candidatus Thalassospirochaeta sargassi TaxID=3119039 RepID=A0AAJ1MIP5_9SPIO|nr:DUF2804 domain-containing protein [Spirochaetales bacterium]